MKKLFVIMVSGILVLASCEKKYVDLEVNPNVPAAVPASLVLRGILTDMNERPWNDVQRWNQFWCLNYNYYGTNEYNWGGVPMNYFTLKNVVKMEEEAKKSGAPDINPYSALGKFIRAYYFYLMTSKVGDIPMTEALQGTQNLTPKYNTQKEIFIQVLNWLEQANTDLTKLISDVNTTLDGDIYFNNDLSKWRKVVNTFKLRVLIALSKKEGDADLAIKSKFQQVWNNKSTTTPIMEGLADNMAFRYGTFNKYPTNPDNFGFDATRQNMSKVHIDLNKQLNDPRIYVQATPAPARLTSGLTTTDFNAYEGASSGEGLDDMSSKANAGQYSFINRKRYYANYVGEPCIQIGYLEMCFNIAEAMNRGWITGDAEQWYKNGIMASMAFYGIQDGSMTVEFNGYTSATTINLNNYYNQTSVKYAGNNITGLTQIIQQKYLAFFNNSGWEAYFNWRRTGQPVFLSGPGTGNSGVIPKRYQYPLSEKQFNTANVNAAIQSQYSGNDNLNSAMWLIQ
jgi:hypothetical protein